MSYRRSPEQFRIHRWTGLSGVAAAVLFAGGNLLWVFEQPAQGAQVAEILDFYDRRSTQVVAAALLSLVSYAVLIAFASGLRAIIAAVEGDGLLADLAFGGVVFSAAAGAGAETMNMAAGLRAGDGELTDDLALTLFDVSFVFGSYAFAVGLGILMLAVSVAALRHGTLLPRWAARVSAAIGVALITPAAVLAAGVWALTPPVLFVLAVAVIVLRGEARPNAPGWRPQLRAPG